VKSVIEPILANDSHSKSKFKITKDTRIVKMTRKKKGDGILSFQKHSTKLILVSNSHNEDSSS
jgi:hypothetical protein